ncbi:putative ATP-dependent RNA helicase SoYb [Drosophila nasuta]|uniref:putative ATP-dependent RNA helicase SoYb n=1 Tax=Drosophila nasuta TaxID=42062 RepID=UPI00295F18DB|nr:putative ATP-dependent RNA helicase SoYb [Drosophila nasuta]
MIGKSRISSRALAANGVVGSNNETQSDLEPTTSNNQQKSEQLSSHLSDGVKYIYFTPNTQANGYDFIAKSIKTKDFNNVRIAIICEHATNAQQMMREMGKRSVASLLLTTATTTAIANKKASLDGLLALQSDGVLTSVLIATDDMLPTLAHYGKVKVELLIHSTQPLPHVFQKRANTFILSEGNEKERQVIVIRTPAVVEQLSQIEASNPIDALLSPLPSLLPSPMRSPLPSSLSSPLPLPSSLSSPLPLPLLSQRSPTQLDDDAMSSTSVSSCSLQSMPHDPIEDASATSMLNTYNKFEVLALSKQKLESCYQISDIKALDGRIKAAMTEMSHEHGKKPHRYAWPHTANHRSLCVIGYEASGKTWSYLPWLCHKALQNADEGRLGACCIILCPDARHGEKIAVCCEKLLSTMDEKKPVVMRLFEQDKIQMVLATLKVTCGILMTSVELLLLAKDEIIFDANFVRCMAFDNINVLWNQSKNDCEQLIDWLFENLSIGVSGTQMLISGRQWCEAVMNRLLPKLDDVLLLFTDALEASLYGRIQQEMLFIDPQRCEVEILKVLLSKNLKEERVVMVCDSNDEANYLMIHLLSAGIRSIIINKSNQVNTFKKWSHEKRRNVVIAIDDMIPKLRGGRIDLLFHYKPASNWRRFKTRFGLFYGNYKTQTKEESHSNATSIICITQKDGDVIWCMCNFLLKHEIAVPSAWLTSFNEFRLTAERLNPIPKQPMCEQMLSYGNCWVRKCQYRHQVAQKELARPIEYFNKLHIEFYISYIHTPTRFVIKDTSLPIAHLYGGLPITKLEDSINLHYIKASNRSLHPNPRLNDICVVELKERYQRVVVIGVNGKQIKVRQLDNVMEEVNIKASEVFVCKEFFIHEPVQCQELCLTGIMPCTTERIWSAEDKKLVLNVFLKERQTHRLSVFNADIDFAFNDKYFARNIFDSNGNDLKSFVLNNMPVLHDEKVLISLQKLFN